MPLWIPWTKRNDSGPKHLEEVIIVYWLLFWLANGLDKFLNNTNLGPITWWGKDRTEQFTAYFSLMDLPEKWTEVVLLSLGVWEIYIAILFLSCGICIILQGRQLIFWRLARYGFFLSAVTFTSFSVFDILAGDRFELMEHNIYMGMAVLSWFVFAYRRDRMGGQQSDV